MCWWKRPASVLSQQTVVNTRPQTPQDVILRGIAAFEKKRYAHAEKLLSEGLRVERHSIDAIFHLALTYLKTKRFGEAARLFQRVLKLNPVEPFALLNIGVAHDHMGNTRMAIYYYNKELKVNAFCLQAHYNLGQIFFSRKRWGKARDHLLICFDKDQAPQLANDLAWSAYKSRDFALEESVYKKTLKREDRDVWALNNLAAILIDKRRIQEARALLEKANSLSSTDAVVMRNLARTEV